MAGSKEAKRRNAVRGALQTWCPECKHKGAILRSGVCRYCGVRPDAWHKGRRALLEDWILENPQERDPEECFVSWRYVERPKRIYAHQPYPLSYWQKQQAKEAQL